MKNLLYISNSSHDKPNLLLDVILNDKTYKTNILHRNKSYLIKKNFKKFNLSYLFEKLRVPLNFDFNFRIINSILNNKFDKILIVKGSYIFPITLWLIKKKQSDSIIVNWSLDNMCLRHNNNLWYLLSIKYYDVLFTAKTSNIIGLNKLGAKSVKYITQAYSKKHHYPSQDEKKIDVLFIGCYEKDRFQHLLFLSQNNIKVTIYGNGWEKIKSKNLNSCLIINTIPLLGDDYRKAISQSKICLCFLRKINFDQHTSRSIEIPAISTLMIAEKTNEHLELFNEKEAVYFNDRIELLNKVKYYLNNKKEREIIANNGYQRCISSPYSYEDMWVSIKKNCNEKD